MDQKALTDLNIGENLDNLANLDRADTVFAAFSIRPRASIPVCPLQ